MQYKRPEQPGCGGCFLLLLLFILLTGGFPALFSFLGTLIYSGIFGILLLFGLFWGFTYWMQKKVSSYESSQTESHNRFVWLLVQILVDIAKIDGRVSKEEISTIQRFFQYNLRYNQAQMFWVKNLIKEAVSSSQPMADSLREFRDTFAYEPRLILLELVYQILYAEGGQVPDTELQMARNIADYLQITDYDKRTIEAKYKYGGGRQTGGSHSSADQYYAILGLEPGADQEAIKKAYRKLSMKYHPDKVSHLGEEFRGVAEEKMKEINAAYDYLKKL
ncbi:MAG: DnaJ domain-containing protein [Proteobacteria bacterium]|nr:DnaJ domain-containing protein [Pseudomonadota bacterium]MBU1057776.1 DnaJ domain-containing protein [Pseudomonadota bacterium]